MRRFGLRWWWLAPVPLVAIAMHLLHPGREQTVEVTRAQIVQTTVVSGRVLPSAKVHLGVLARGRAARVLVEAGAEVRRGELLLVLEDAEAKAALAKAEARLASANARRSQLADRGVRSVRTQIERAEAELAHALAHARRTEQLVASGSLAVVEEEAARVQVARAREQAETARLSLIDALPGGGDGQIAAASMRDALADVALARARLEQTKVVAPDDGVILERNAEVGDILEPGTRAFVMAVKGPLRLRVLPDERALGLLKLGNLARCSADAFARDSFDARVEWIAPGVDERRGTIEVRLLVPDPPAYLKPDMTVSVTIRTSERSSALVLPPEAIRDPDSTDPWVLVRRGRSEVRASVRVGLRSDRAIEIVDGLAEGEHVVLAAPTKAPGQKIHPWD